MEKLEQLLLEIPEKEDALRDTLAQIPQGTAIEVLFKPEQVSADTRSIVRRILTHDMQLLNYVQILRDIIAEPVEHDTMVRLQILARELLHRSDKGIRDAVVKSLYSSLM